MKPALPGVACPAPYYRRSREGGNPGGWRSRSSTPVPLPLPITPITLIPQITVQTGALQPGQPKGGRKTAAGPNGRLTARAAPACRSPTRATTPAKKTPASRPYNLIHTQKPANRHSHATPQSIPHPHVALLPPSPSTGEGWGEGDSPPTVVSARCPRRMGTWCGVPLPPSPLTAEGRACPVLDTGVRVTPPPQSSQSP